MMDGSMSTKTKSKAARVHLALGEPLELPPVKPPAIRFSMANQVAQVGASAAVLPAKIGPGLGLPDNPPARAQDAPVRPGDFIVGAAQIASRVAANPGDALNPTDMQHAEWWMCRAEEPLTGEQLDIYTGGELSPIPAYIGGGVPMASVELRNTVQNADLVTAHASLERLELARDAGALETGLDAAQTIGAANSLEKMLAHQMAAMHGSTMKMVAQLNACIGRMHSARYDTRPDRPDSDRERANVQAVRLAGAISRMSSTFQQGLVTVQRLRSGGQQVVTVQHVQVNEGGQAIVAGKMKAGGGRRRKGGGCENGR
jgi:hypothetical protein